MITRKFICKEHPEGGFNGWRPSWMPHFDPMPGLGVAHDTLEHLVSDDGTVEAEFKAFGAIVWLRDGASWFGRNGTDSDVAVHMSGDIREQAEYLNSECRRLRAAPRTQRLSDDCAEEAIERCIQKGFKEILDECSESTARLLNRNDVRSYMRIGYRRTQRRFAAAGPHNMAWVFDQIVEQADRKLKGAELDDELIVRVDATLHRVYVDTCYPE
ncbi:hypothetical protein AB6809_29565 [Paraburkholderia sp. RCC_158]|uniref:hypothetical protein n=1 Tax=Paraburkholderia sp. RCC_158 TaxID=3239220 RepID=UPI0035235C1C